MKLYVLNGPNLNLLGVREPDQYGTETFAHLTERIAAHAAARGIEVIQRQSNHEGDLVDWIQEAYFARRGRTGHQSRRVYPYQHCASGCAEGDKAPRG